MDGDLNGHPAADLDGAFERMVRGHQHGVYVLALGLVHSAEEAEEVAQETFVRAYRALQRYEATRREELRVRPWLATIALNVCRNRARRLARRPAWTLDGAGALADARPGPEAQAEVADGRRTWAALLAGLPARYREPVVLRHVEGLSYDEVAEALGRPVGTVKAQVHRGVRLLREAAMAEGMEDT